MSKPTEEKDTSRNYLVYKTLEEKFAEYLDENLLEVIPRNIAIELAKIARQHFSHFGDD